MATLSDRTQKIPLYARRTLGEKINAAIDFLRQNWRVALRFSIYLLLPLSLLHSVGLFTFIRSLTSDYYNSTDIGFLSSSFITLFSLCLIYTLILTLFQYYQGSDDGDLSMLTFRDVKGQMWYNFKRILIVMIPIVLLVIPVTLLVLAMLIVPFFSVWIVAGCAILVFILMMVPIHYTLENVTLGNAFGRSFSHARESWMKLFGLMFAMLLVVGIIQSVTTIPMLIFIFATDNLTPSGEMGSTLKMVFDIILYVFLILETFFGYLSMALVITTLVYHYGSNAREQDDLAIASDIENFANL
jgi:hypothetical protein